MIIRRSFVNDCGEMPAHRLDSVGWHTHLARRDLRTLSGATGLPAGRMETCSDGPASARANRPDAEPVAASATDRETPPRPAGAAHPDEGFTVSNPTNETTMFTKQIDRRRVVRTGGLVAGMAALLAAPSLARGAGRRRGGVGRGPRRRHRALRPGNAGSPLRATADRRPVRRVRQHLPGRDLRQGEPRPRPTRRGGPLDLPRRLLR